MFVTWADEPQANRFDATAWHRKRGHPLAVSEPHLHLNRPSYQGLEKSSSCVTLAQSLSLVMLMLLPLGSRESQMGISAHNCIRPPHNKCQREHRQRLSPYSQGWSRFPSNSNGLPGVRGSHARSIIYSYQVTLHAHHGGFCTSRMRFESPAALILHVISRLAEAWLLVYSRLTCSTVWNAGAKLTDHSIKSHMWFWNVMIGVAAAEWLDGIRAIDTEAHISASGADGRVSAILSKNSSSLNATVWLQPRLQW